jgi:hypothetical protein
VHTPGADAAAGPGTTDTEAGLDSHHKTKKTLPPEERRKITANFLLENDQFLKALKTIALTDIPINYVKFLRPIRDAILIREDGTHYINSQAQLIGTFVEIKDGILTFQPIEEGENEIIEVDTIVDQYGLEKHVGQMNGFSYEIRTRGEIYANKHEKLINLLCMFCKENEVVFRETEKETTPQQEVLKLELFATQFLTFNYDISRWWRNLFVETDENNKTIFHYIAELVNKANTETFYTYLNEISAIPGFFPQQLLDSTLAITSRNGTTCLDIITNKEKN